MSRKSRLSRKSRSSRQLDSFTNEGSTTIILFISTGEPSKPIEVPNPRFSTTSSGAGESEDLALNQLVVAQVHHDPILEMRSAEESEKEEPNSDQNLPDGMDLVFSFRVHFSKPDFWDFKRNKTGHPDFSPSLENDCKSIGRSFM